MNLFAGLVDGQFKVKPHSGERVILAFGTQRVGLLKGRQSRVVKLSARIITFPSLVTPPMPNCERLQNQSGEFVAAVTRET